jgi:hypothetical protein
MANNITAHWDFAKLPPELFLLVHRTYQDKPDPKDVWELQKKLEELPELWMAVFDMTKEIKENLIEKTTPKEAVRLSLKKNVSALINGLGYEKSTSLERLLIDNVVITWLRLQWMELQVISFIGQDETKSTIEYWDKRLLISQRSHLHACETLARVRRLMSGRPAVQVNIASDGGQQVNVTGDVIKK